MKTKYIKPYKNAPLFQFWFEDGILHMWSTVRSGLYTIPLNDKEEMHFLADVYHHLSIEEGTVYEFKGIHKQQSSESTTGEKS